MSKITQIWESPTNEGTLHVSLGFDYSNSYDHRTHGLGKCLSINGKQNESGGYWEVVFENGTIYLNDTAVGTRHEPE